MDDLGSEKILSSELYHYGTPRHSGRYPWGSGEDPYQHEKGAFLARVAEYRKNGLTNKEIANLEGMTTKELISTYSAYHDARRRSQAARAWELHLKGYGPTEIGRIMGGVPEGTVRSWIKTGSTVRASKTQNTVNVLKDAVKNREFIDVSEGTECWLGISQTKLNTAVKELEKEGYAVHKIKVQQLGTQHKTSITVLCPPGTTWKDVITQQDKISMVTGYHSNDDGGSFELIKPPTAVDPKRVMIRYAEDGGVEKDGVIELRRGVEDLSLGEYHYAQVRIKVGTDEGSYAKGMAVYSDDMPEGVDIIFNTNKHSGTPMEKVLKPTKKDKDTGEELSNPFGTTLDDVVGQREYVGSDGQTHLSAINIVKPEGAVSSWSNTIASQVLSKQTPKLAKQQLDKAYDARKEEFEELTSLTNPAVKQKLLQDFAESCDSDAVDLAAAALPRQSWNLILPVNSLKPNEIYAPNYDDGESVVLIRYPHGGIFEIPELTVNNKNAEGKRVLGATPRDAVGINHIVAQQLSGADFDGDTVLVIPNNDKKIRTHSPLEGLKNFDPAEKYSLDPEIEKVGPKTGFRKQAEMGGVSNLITDMTIKGADLDEIARAVRYSMVVIDAEKHNYDWRRSFDDERIADLKEKYQGGARRGASTIISKASSEYDVPATKQVWGKRGINPETGEKILTPTGETYMKGRTLKSGEVQYKETKVLKKSTKMAETKDAYELLSSDPTEIEIAYADYANQMKSLANQARKAYVETPNQKYSPEAKVAYQAEVDSLNAKLVTARKNKPLERQAQISANLKVKAIKEQNPELFEDKDQVKKLKSQTLAAARNKVGASGKNSRIKITPKEWEAIQAGAITHNKLMEILTLSDEDAVRSYATPRPQSGLTPAQLNRIKSMASSGKYSTADIAKALGISTSSVYAAIDKKD